MVRLALVLCLGATSALAQPLVSIHDVQGTGDVSPLVNATVLVRGVVTVVRADGFFFQETDASIDADPNTSEGLFVSTGAAPPPAVGLGNTVRVTATVREFAPTSTPQALTRTELANVTNITLLASGSPFPSPALLAPASSGLADQLERFEGMLVTVNAMTVTGPTTATINEALATATSTGAFHATLSAVPRPFREAGIRAPFTSWAGTIPPIPRWDGNPELLAVRSPSSAVLDVNVGDTVVGVGGVLDGAGRYTVLLTNSVTVTPAPLAPIGVTPATSREVTIASVGLARLFDGVDAPGATDVVLTAGALDRRLGKASQLIRVALSAPDVVAVQDVENLALLQSLAARIDADAADGGLAVPTYVAQLVSGTDPAGLNLGFLVSARQVGGAPRVQVSSVQQLGSAAVNVHPNGSMEPLFRQPPLRLDAVVRAADGQTFSVSVVNVAIASDTNVESTAVGPNGWPSLGASVAALRIRQALFVADSVQSAQTSTPNLRLVLTGQLNAHAVNDGYADVLGTLLGDPLPATSTASDLDGLDRLTPNLTRVTASIPSQRYTATEEGSLVERTHALVTTTLMAATPPRLEYARTSSAFAGTVFNAPTALGASTGDPLVLYLEAFAPSDGGVDAGSPVDAGAAVDGGSVTDAGSAGGGSAGGNAAGGNASGGSAAGGSAAGGNAAGATQLVAAQPVAAQPVATQLVGAQLVATHLAVTHPAAAQPVAAQPVATQLAGTQPVATQLVAMQLAGTQPAVTQLVAMRLAETRLAGMRLAGMQLVATRVVATQAVAVQPAEAPLEATPLAAATARRSPQGAAALPSSIQPGWSR